MKLLIALFALMGVILAAPQGFVGVHVVPGDIPALHSAGKLRVQEGREDLKDEHLEYRIGFNSGGGSGSQGVYGVSSPDVGGQSERFNPGSSGVFAGMDGYNGAGPQDAGQREELKNEHPEYPIGFNSGGGFGSQGVYGVSSPDVGGQSERFNLESSGVPEGMDGYSGAGPQVAGQREELKDEHPEYQIGFNSGGGFGSQGVYGVSSPYVGGQSERFNPGSSGVSAGMDGYSEADPQFVGQREELKNGHPEFRIGFNSGGGFGSQGVYGVSSPDVGGQSERFNPGSSGEFAGMDGYNGAGPQFVGQREELQNGHPEYPIGINSGGGFGSQGVYGVSSPDVGGQSGRFNLESSGVLEGMDGYSGAGPQVAGQREELKNEHLEYPIGFNSGGGFGSQGVYGVSSPDVGDQSERFNPGSWGVLAGMDEYNGADPQFVGQREELKNEHLEYPIGFNSGGGFGSQGAYGVSSPDVGGQSERFNPGSSGELAGMDEYNGAGLQFVGQREELQNGHPDFRIGFNSGGGFGSQGIYGVSSRDVGGQSERFNPGSSGEFAGMDGYNGASPQFVGQREELQNGHPEYPIGFNSGEGFGSQGVYGVSSPDVGGQSERFNPGSSGVFAGMDGYNGAGPQDAGQREELKDDRPGFNSRGGFGSQGVYGVSIPYGGYPSTGFNFGHPGEFGGMEGYSGTGPQVVGKMEELTDERAEYRNGFNSGGQFGNQAVYGVSSPDVGGQSERFNPGSSGVFAGMDGYNGAGPQFVGHREEFKNGHPEYPIVFNSGGGFGSQGFYGVSSPDVGGQNALFNLENLGGKSQTLNNNDNRGAYGVAGANIGVESDRFKGFSNGEGVDGHGTQAGLQRNNSHSTFVHKCAFCNPGPWARS